MLHPMYPTIPQTVADYYLKERYKATQHTQSVKLTVEEQIKKIEANYKPPKVPWVRCCLECGDPLTTQHLQCCKCHNSFCSKHVRSNTCHKCRVLVADGRDPAILQFASELVTNPWYVQIRHYQSELNVEMIEYEYSAGGPLNMGFKIFSEEDRILYNKIVRAEHKIGHIMLNIKSLTENMPSSVAHLISRTKFASTLSNSINDTASRYSVVASKMTTFRVKYYNQVSWA